MKPEPDRPDACTCGGPPYDDGPMCPACQAFYVASLRRRAEAGQLTPMQAFALSLLTGPEPDAEPTRPD